MTDVHVAQVRWSDPDMLGHVNHARYLSYFEDARMEAVGYVTRGTTPEDGRGVVATMTDQGYDLLVRAAPCHVESVRRNIVDLVPTEDFAAVGRVFDRVADHLVNRHPESEIRQS